MVLMMTDITTGDLIIKEDHIIFCILCLLGQDAKTKELVGRVEYPYPYLSIYLCHIYLSVCLSTYLPGMNTGIL